MASRAKTTEVTAPAIPADEAFANVVTATRDAAVVETQKLESQLAARQGQYDRDRARLDAAWQADSESLTDQIGRQIIIQEGCDAALHVMSNGRGVPNVVPMAAE